ERGYLRKLRRSGLLRRTALRTSVRDPSSDQLDFVIGKNSLANEMRIGGIGWPRRHVARLGHGRDRLRLLLHVFIGKQGEWPGLARTVTGCAVLKDDGCNVFRKIGIFFDAGGGFTTLRHQKENNKKPLHQAIAADHAHSSELEWAQLATIIPAFRSRCGR